MGASENPNDELDTFKAMPFFRPHPESPLAQFFAREVGTTVHSLLNQQEKREITFLDAVDTRHAERN